jgi:putative ABC transport system ATP-binding protein
MDLLFAKRAERNSTLVIVTHDAALARRCDRVIRMNSGRVEEPAREAAEAGKA